MIKYTKKTLENGLTLIVHEDHSSPLVAVNLLYNVGSRDEDESQTGLAHLFEHLMFSGSKNIDDFDAPLQEAGGENNAFTNADITNYYEVLPYQNLDTALWLESDRMLNLNLSEHNVTVQKKVVLEEFNETCLNKPYGDTWHHLSALCYKEASYKWPTIGLVPDHIKSVSHGDAIQFYKRHYRPDNAILVIAGHVQTDEAIAKANTWFSTLKNPSLERPQKKMRQETQEAKRQKTVEGQVPATAIHLAFPMPARNDPDFYTYDILSDILGLGQSSRLYEALQVDQKLFSSISCYVTGTAGPGLLIIEGKLMQGVDIETAKSAIWSELQQLKERHIDQRELEKVKNNAISYVAFSETSLLSKAMSLAHFEWLGDVDEINKQLDYYAKVTAEDLFELSKRLFVEANLNEFVYKPKI